jgi:hypothetical protein
MTLRAKQPRTLLEAAYIKYGLTLTETESLAGTNMIRIHMLLRGIAPAKPPLRARLLRVTRHRADDPSITEADLFPVEG